MWAFQGHWGGKDKGSSTSHKEERPQEISYLSQDSEADSRSHDALWLTEGEASAKLQPVS
jgi:hypothetical protein